MKKVLVAVLLLAGVCGVSKAADNKWEVGLLPGISIPVSGDWADSDSGFKSSFALAGYGDYRINDMFAAGLDLGYDFGHKPQIDIGDNVKIKILQITPHAKVIKDMTMFGKAGKVYGVLGAGLYNLKVTSDSGNETFVNGDTSVSKFGFNLGGGADVALAPNWLLGLEVRWHHVFSALENATTGDKIALNNITPTLKVAYTF